MWSVRTSIGNGELTKVTIESTDSLHGCEIYNFGATVTSWIQNGTERLFLSPKAYFDGVKAIRGGIPLVFPQFSQPNKDMAQHGFARNSLWDFVDFQTSPDEATANFRLQENIETLRLWQHKFNLIYSVRLNSSSLTCTLSITNSDDSPFSCHALLHTYLRVPDISDVQVIGFQNHCYKDKVLEYSEHIERNEIIHVTSEVDRVYFPSPSSPSKTNNTEDPTIPIGDIHVKHSLGSIVVSKNASISTASSSSSSCVNVDVVLWNPWIEKASAVADLGETTFKSFLCVEPGVVSDWACIQPLETLTLSQRLEITSA